MFIEKICRGASTVSLVLTSIDGHLNPIEDIPANNFQYTLRLTVCILFTIHKMSVSCRVGFMSEICKFILAIDRAVLANEKKGGGEFKERIRQFSNDSLRSRGNSE